MAQGYLACNLTPVRYTVVRCPGVALGGWGLSNMQADKTLRA